MAFFKEGFLIIGWNSSISPVQTAQMPLNIDDVHQAEVSTLEVYKHICVAAAFSLDLKANPGRPLQW